MESNTTNTNTNTVQVRQVLWLLIVISASLMLGRIIAVDDLFNASVARLKFAQINSRLEQRKLDEQKQGRSEAQIKKILAETKKKLQIEVAQYRRPFLSANDRSRWCTIRALVEPDMRVKDADGKTVWFAIDIVQNQPGWDTIDMIKHTIPPSDDNELGYLYSSKPTLLPVLMTVPYYLIYNASGGRISFENDTYFLVRTILVLINLIPVVFCWFLMGRLIERFGKNDWSKLFVMSFVCFGTFVSSFIITLNNHIPGICCVVISMYAASRIIFDGRRELRYYIISGFFAAFLYACELPGLSYTVFLMLVLLKLTPRETLLGYLPMVLIVFAASDYTNYCAHQTHTPAYANKQWYNYKYERGKEKKESHWNNRKGTVDEGEKSRLTYVLHTTVGHHGIFSLTPVWFLSFAGLFCLLKQKNDKKLFYAALFILSLSVICYVFYMFRPQPDRNYGGMTCGLRWMFWFIPLWIVAMLPVTDRLACSRCGRILCTILLIASIMSVAYPIWNPWDHPWFSHFMRYIGISVLGWPAAVG